MFAEADRLFPKDNVARLTLARRQAVVEEHLGRFDKAVAMLEETIARTEQAPREQAESRGQLAMAYLRNDRADDARALVEALPDAGLGPIATAAHCALLWHDALREPEGDAMREALRAFETVLRGYPRDLAYPLVEQFADLVLASVDAASTKEHHALVERALNLARDQAGVRPDCPGLYLAAARLSEPLGDTDAEARFRELHETKEREHAGKPKAYDLEGRPRCR
jgi:tetratricopeptide (TPR) repeat protein